MVDVESVVDTAAVRMGVGESGVIVLMDVVRHHELRDYEILELIAEVAAIANRRLAGAA